MRNSDNSVPSRFPSETQLTEHQQEHEKVKHSKEQLPSKLFICEICGRALPKRKALKIHKNKVHGPKIKAQCNYCGKWYATRQHMLAHVYNMHTAADIEHRCDLCGFCASSPSALYQHKRFRHDPEKKHKCSVCDKSFKTRVQLKVSLKENQISHSNKKKINYFPIMLQEHTATHTGIDLYKCAYCDTTFKFQSNRCTHYRRMHPEHFNRTVRRSKPTVLTDTTIKMETMEEDNDDNAADYDLKSLEIVILPMSPKMEDIVDNYC